jgi:uncharacterized protein
VNKRIRASNKKQSNDFVCLCCGTCCSIYQPRISLDEVHIIAGKLNLSVSQFVEQYTDRRWPGTQSYLIRHVNSACVFLKPSLDNRLKLCSIHDFKPICCLEWQASSDRRECQTGINQQKNFLS